MHSDAVVSVAYFIGLVLLSTFLTAALGWLALVVMRYVTENGIRSLLALFDPRRYARIAWLWMLERYGSQTSVWRTQHERMAGDSEHKTRDPDYEWPKK